MKTLIRLSSLTAVAILAAACSSGATTAPVATTAGMSGTITIWEAYGASGAAERDAFDTMVAAVKTDNPGLNVTVLDIPFSDLFSKFETAAATGGGPDLYIAPNDSLPTEARAGLLLDESSLSACHSRWQAL